MQNYAYYVHVNITICAYTYTYFCVYICIYIKKIQQILEEKYQIQISSNFKLLKLVNTLV